MIFNPISHALIYIETQFSHTEFGKYTLTSICFVLSQTSSLHIQIFKVQLTEKKIQIGGKQPSGFFLANISLLLNEQVPFANKNLTV